MIKGGGGALTREKIVAAVARKFVCIVDAVEARRRARQVSAAGRSDPDGAQLRRARARASSAAGRRCAQGFTTDNGNVILDVHGLSIVDPVELEAGSTQIAGVVTVGLFARAAPT